jgi:uncharacterized protein YdcH (DUF465 family)
MDEQRHDSHYEALYTQLLERGMDLHMNNKKRIRVGLILLLLSPVILGIILKLTQSDKIVFLIIWVICMFVICVYLISIEYIDDSVKKTLEEVTEREANFDKLFMDSEKLEERINARHESIMERISTLREDRALHSDKAAAPDTAEKPEAAESEDEE